MRIASLTIGLVATFAIQASAFAGPDENGRLQFKRCAACHLATGEGVPGAFPSLKTPEVGSFYETDEGRLWLVHVVNSGLAGEITSGGKTYRGFMPAQGGALGPEGIADVLNFVLHEFHPARKDPTSFTADEVKALLDTHGKPNPRTLSETRRALLEKGTD
ncbi:c-type cytochrome [Gimibacter soli]|uniref:Cytochrome c n=1 Tax=Gimibacter soli TaxID=3024400 RepID=A0AAE9XM02_9PROT|nr:cytochrome c [Gimibacter soli]WCL53404.1 cytochrome c [Gimibacter soli]